jgi:hypothetical protein
MSTTTELPTQNGEATGLMMDHDGGLIGVAMTAVQLADRKSRLAKIASMDTKQAQKISSEYWEATAGDTIRGEFLGFKILTKKDESEEGGEKKILAVVIDTLDGIRLCGAMQLVESFRTGVPQGAAVLVTCTKAKSGVMKEFEVFVFEETEDVSADVQ